MLPLKSSSMSKKKKKFENFIFIFTILMHFRLNSVLTWGEFCWEDFTESSHNISFLLVKIRLLGQGSDQYRDSHNFCYGVSLKKVWLITCLKIVWVAVWKHFQFEND